MIILGLCCISKVLQDRKPPVKCRVIQRKNYTVEKAIEAGRLNLEDVYKLLKYAAQNEIYSVRLASELLPRYTDRTVEQYKMDQFQDLFTKIGHVARTHNIRLSFHPDQFVVLSSDNPIILQSSIDELEYQCEMLARMNVAPEYGVCNIHGGGVYGLEKDVVKQRWADNYQRLSPIVKRYLTLENDERSYSLQDCLDINKLCGVPVVYDTFHEECYRGDRKHCNEVVDYRPLEEMLPEVLKTWTVRLRNEDGDFHTYDRIPMAHVSNQKPNDRVGAHSDYITRFPEILFQYSQLCDTLDRPEYARSLYLDVEAKAKDLAVFALREQYPEQMI